MRNFSPNDYLTVQLQKSDEIDLYAHVVATAHIKGAFFTEVDKKVTVNIYGPSGKLLDYTTERQQGIIEFTADVPGLHKIMVKAKQPCSVTLALHLPVMEDYDDIHEDLLLNSPEWATAWYENKQHEVTTNNDLARLDKMLNEGLNLLVGVQNEVKMGYTRQLMHSEASQANVEYQRWIGVCEAALVSGVSLLALWWIKNSVLR